MVQNAGLSVGALLRSRREELGHDRETVSKQLRIRTIYIRAIEEGRMQDLPGSAYAVGFVRTYADFLGFDGNSVVDNFREEIAQRGHPEPVNWKIDGKEGGFPWGRLVVILAIVAAAAYGLWYYLANTQSGTNLIEAVPEYLKKNTSGDKPAAPASNAPAAPTAPTPSQTPAPESTPAPTPSGSSSEANPTGNAPLAQPGTGETPANPIGAAGVPAAQVPAGAGMATTPPATVQPATQAPAGQSPGSIPVSSPAPTIQGQPAQGQATQGQATQGQTAPSQTTPGQVMPVQPLPGTQPGAAQTQANVASPAAGQMPGVVTSNQAPSDIAAAAAGSTTRISVKAKLESWVQINDKDGKPVLSRVLRAGETYAVPDQKGLVMDTGNAGGIEMVVDGKTLPSLGSVGLVKRNIALDPDRLATGDVNVKAPVKTEPAAGNGGGAPAGD